MSNSVLYLKNVWKKYKRNDWVVRNINFEIKKGEVVGLIGHNGAGKTTIIKSIMNLIFIQKGEIYILGIPNFKEVIKKYVGYLPEYPFLPPYYKVREIFDIGMKLKKLDNEETKNKIKEYIEIFKLKEFENKEISILSKGNLQKVSIIFSLILNPELYLWDEPSQNLDPVARKNLRDIIISESMKGKTFLISSHILTEVEKICNRIILIKKGEIIFDLKIEDIVKKWGDLENFYIEVYK
ncbi:MAG: ABC transporter ATP-binding protein [candidate division WOR-3 bacterium]